MWSHLWLSGYYSIIVIVCAHINLICCAEGGELVPRREQILVYTHAR